jgi:hypothetical protein
MVEWLGIGRMAGWLASKTSGRARRWASDKQKLVDETAPVVSQVKELIRRATPMEASIERGPGEIPAKMQSWDESWKP